MAIDKKLIYIKTESIFNTLLNNNEIDEKSIVFIEDSKRIWTHGNFFDGYLSDSPQDGKIYGRKDGDWTDVDSDMYDWTWLEDIYPSGTCTQQQYDDLLAAVQTGKLFPHPANSFVFPIEEIEEDAIILNMIHIFDGDVQFGFWDILPDLTVVSNFFSLETIVSQFIDRKVELRLGGGSSTRTIYLSSSNFPILSGFTTITVNLDSYGESENDGKEYVFQFTCGATPVTLNMPAYITWINEPYIEANKTYQVSIVNRIAVIGGASWVG